MARLGLGDMIGAGRRAVSRYTGMLLAVFVAQSIVAATCILAAALVLARAFGHLPMFDDAVDGDLAALINCLDYGRSSLVAIAGIMFGALMLWQLASWFLVGGIYGVLSQRPEGRGDTARCFGAGGASTYLAYLRLALCGLPGGLVVLFLVIYSAALVALRLPTALAVSDLLPSLAPSFAAALLLHVLFTVSDYARVELTLRHDTHDPGAIATYLRTIGYVFRRPVTLVHGAIGWLLLLLVTVAYSYLAHGHPMYGTVGAITLFVARAGVSLLRMAIRFGVLAGQVELGRTRPLPPRRVELKVDAKM